MTFSDQISTAIIAGVVSIAVSAIGHILAFFKLRSDKQALERTLARKFTESLYELRLKHYPEAFSITENLGKKANWTDEELPEKFNEINEALKHWKSGTPSLILSPKSLTAYFELQKALRANLAKGSKYDDAQIQRIWKLRSIFLDNLRNDVGLLFEEEDRHEPYEYWNPRRTVK